jgi:hypothetical protein
MALPEHGVQAIADVRFAVIGYDADAHLNAHDYPPFLDVGTKRIPNLQDIPLDVNF